MKYIWMKLIRLTNGLNKEGKEDNHNDSGFCFVDGWWVSLSLRNGTWEEWDGAPLSSSGHINFD